LRSDIINKKMGSPEIDNTKGPFNSDVVRESKVLDGVEVVWFNSSPEEKPVDPQSGQEALRKSDQASE
jgi:hypothetical protein